MILTRQKILSEIRKKRIVIEPFDQSAIGPASIDLTLDNTIRVFRKGFNSIEVNANQDYKTHTKLINIDRGYDLKPGELVLGITKERIQLPDDVCGWLQSRSRFARLGLMSHCTAPFVCPGVNNHQILEIFNAGPRRLRLVPGIRICQIILSKCIGKAGYSGIFMNQTL